MKDEIAPSLGRRLLDGWMAIAGRFGSVQTSMILVMTYVLVIGPIGLGLAVLRRDLLCKRGWKVAESSWLVADTAKPDLERAKLLS